MSSDNRFNLDGINAHKAKIDEAMLTQRTTRDRSTQKLIALTNLPWLIALVAWLLWKYL
ncbi:hypothetical protein [Silvimonas iriomotensis]|uniref:hypothetical protein n=1 Tax=Silvimonas iriomotensis TaxID=449662 RepID=UPI00166DAF4A|nr:hypothetical protein [Silvimonas iriomotensis]